MVLLWALGVAHAGCGDWEGHIGAYSACADGAAVVGLIGTTWVTSHRLEPRRTEGRSDAVTVRWSDSADRTSDWLSPGGLGAGPGLLPMTVTMAAGGVVGATLGSDTHPDAGGALAGAAAVSEAVWLTWAVTDIGKNAFARPRPYTSPAYEASDPTRWAEVIEDAGDGAYRSMPSGHVSLAAAATSSVAATWFVGALHVRKRGGRASLAGPVSASVASLGLTSATAALRVSAGKHHVGDTLVGAAVGLGLGVAVPGLHGALRRGDARLTLGPGRVGVSGSL